MSLSAELKGEAHRLGFSAVGICQVDASDSEQALTTTLHARLAEWLRRGYHGTMQWLAREPSRRADPRQVLPGCRSVISLGINYYTADRADEGAGRGRIARYAWGEDYHEVLRERLERLESFLRARRPDAHSKVYVDTGPLMEKAWAQQAGLGWIGKHSNLVSHQFGSWLLLGEILTTVPLEADEPGSDLCGSCSLCIRACPTGAITEPYVVDAGRCISYLTIELRHGEEIPAELADRMGNRIFGCDDCLDVCPYNHQALPTTEEAFQPRAWTLAPDLQDLARMSEPDFAAAFRTSPLKRPKHAGFLRNVRIALRNTARPSALATPAPAGRPARTPR